MMGAVSDHTRQCLSLLRGTVTRIILLIACALWVADNGYDKYLLANMREAVGGVYWAILFTSSSEIVLGQLGMSYQDIILFANGEIALAVSFSRPPVDDGICSAIYWLGKIVGLLLAIHTSCAPTKILLDEREAVSPEEFPVSISVNVSLVPSREGSASSGGSGAPP